MRGCSAPKGSRRSAAQDRISFFSFPPTRYGGKNRLTDRSESRFVKTKHVLTVASGIFVLGAVFFALVIPKARKRAESIQCASSVVSVCLAGRVWAEDHAGVMPTNLICMSNELNTPK